MIFNINRYYYFKCPNKILPNKKYIAKNGKILFSDDNCKLKKARNS